MASENRRKYQSNEFITDLGLNWMDFNNRQYDPQIGRFLQVDPLAAFGGQDMMSPYAAMGNMPEMMVDPLGLSPGLDRAETGANDQAGASYAGNLANLLGAGISDGGGGGGWGGGSSWGDWSGMNAALSAFGYGGLANVMEWSKQQMVNRDFNATLEAGGIDYRINKSGQFEKKWGVGGMINWGAAADGFGNKDPFALDNTCTAGGGDSKKGAASNITDGFIGGMRSTWDGILNQFTVQGYLSTQANIYSLGMYGFYQTLKGAGDIITEIPNYTAANYQYGFGFTLEKVTELYLLKKVSTTKVSWSGFSNNNGNLTYSFKLRFPENNNFMIRFERGHRSPFTNTKVPYQGNLFNGFNTHVNIQQPGVYNYHIVLNPFKWKYYGNP